jgi:DNA-binding response OmpR family regulator
VNVLIVDRDPGSSRYTSLALEQAGIRCETAGSPQDALALLEGARGARFDVLLLDVEPAAAKGASLLADLRAKGVQIPAVFLTVRKSLEDRVRSFDLGADDYIVKPFESTELVARLRAVLRRCLGSRSRRADRSSSGPGD